jgi:hypothetical protein
MGSGTNLSGEDILRILKGASAGRFTLTETDDALLDCSSSALAALHDDVAREVDSEILGRCSDALQWMQASGDETAVNVLREIRAQFGTGLVSLDTIHAFAKRDDIFRTSIARISDEIQEQERAFANELLLPEPNKRLKELIDVLGQDSTTRQIVEDEEDEEDPGESPTGELTSQAEPEWDEAAAAKLLIRSVRRLAVNAAEGRSRPARGAIGRTLEWLGDRVPLSTDLTILGRKIQLQRKLRILDGAARSLVFGVPSIYGRFRRRCMEVGRWFRRQDNLGARQTALSPAEADILILVMLRNARRALQKLDDMIWLKGIEARYLTQVFVDEATDFSAVQLACLLELAHPKLRAWFACGDFRQRITRHGIASPEEFRWIEDSGAVSAIEVREIKIEYRQSARLKVLADALASGDKVLDMAASSGDEDPAPLLVEHVVGDQLATWLAMRILEVERRVGRLPSIAIFVDGEERIDPVVESIRPKLAEHNLRIVGCRDGRDVGNAQEVRVFNIRHIKGLEFEAVFFIAVDALAERIPDLFQKYIYVGLTRAATFLGVTCQKALPRSLEFVRPLFSNGTWN